MRTRSASLGDSLRSSLRIAAIAIAWRLISATGMGARRTPLAFSLSRTFFGSSSYLIAIKTSFCAQNIVCLPLLICSSLGYERTKELKKGSSFVKFVSFVLLSHFKLWSTTLGLPSPDIEGSMVLRANPWSSRVPTTRSISCPSIFLPNSAQRSV